MTVFRHATDVLTSLRKKFFGPPTPPQELRAGIGPGEFRTIGEEFLGIFRDVAGLQPGERVLDAGCGVGRMARPLVSYLSSGSYEGFDVVAPAVHWCQRNLSPLHPRFRFRHVDVRNGMYNPNGVLAAASFEFPYADNEFDFAFATSVFTHMFAPEVRHYLDEITRVLHPGGRALATFFILDDEALELIAHGKSSSGFQHRWSDGLYADQENPELAVGYESSSIAAAISEAGLELRETHLGNWCERRETLSYQDVVIAEKPSSD